MLTDFLSSFTTGLRREKIVRDLITPQVHRYMHYLVKGKCQETGVSCITWTLLKPLLSEQQRTQQQRRWRHLVTK